MASETEQRLQRYRDAETAVLQGQEVRFEGRSLRRADLEFIANQIERLESKLARQRRAKRGLSPFAPGGVNLPPQGGGDW